MSNFTDFISGGGGGGSPFPTMIFQESTTWACPVAMEALVYVIGAGGSGAFYANPGVNHNAGGGGAGGCSVSKLTLAAQNYTLTIGSGGAAVVGYNAAHGNDGGASSMSGSGMTTMTANGGTAGQYAYNTSTGSGSTGGTATGGTLYNNTGGGVPVNTPTTIYSKSGGGGVGLYAAGQDGTWEQTDANLAEGGKIMGASISSSETTSAVSYDLIYKNNMPVTSQPFAGLSFEFGFQSTSNNGTFEIFSASSGSYSRKNTVATVVHISTSGPFCGGAGYGGSDSAQQFAASGIAGGGGGGMSQGTARYGYSGGGGGGIIIICPISMGA